MLDYIRDDIAERARACKMATIVQHLMAAEDTETTGEDGGDTSTKGGCCKKICRYRCGLAGSVTMMVAQGFVVLLSVSLIKAIVLFILFDVGRVGYANALPETRAILPFLSYTLYPLSGSLLTGVLKRRNLVRHSLEATWAATVGTTALLVLYEAGYVSSSNGYVTTPVLVIAYLVLSLVLAVFHSNIVPLGLEQLESASSGKVVLFLHAYVGLEFFAYGVALLYPAVSSLCYTTNNGVRSVPAYYLYVSLGCAAMVSIVVALNFLCQDHMVIEEPNHPNPLKLIFNVAWYSKKVHSCHYTINISGAPFTSKQVEDVKSFFRFLPIFFPLGLVMATYMVTGTTAPYLLPSPYSLSNSTTCVAAWAGGVPYMVVPAFLLLYNAIVLLCGRCLTIINRIVLGTVLLAFTVAGDIVLTAIQRYIVVAATQHTVLFAFEVTMSAVSGISVLLTSSAVLELVCAQSSFPVKAVLVNLKYAADGLGTSIGVVLLVATFLPGRLVWPYLLASAVTAILAVGISLWNAKKYRNRRRDNKRHEDAMAERVSIFSSVSPSLIEDEPSSVV